MNNTKSQETVKHTPGPWQVYGCAVYQADCWNAGRNEGGKRIGSTFDGSPEDEGDRMPTDEQGANARLISAAPDLLEACKTVLTRQDWPVGTMKIKAQLQAAIAKAEGRAQ